MLATLTTWGKCINAQELSASEHEVKAAFLFKFLAFIEWPASALGAQDPIVIGTLASPAMTRALESAVAHRMAHGRTVAVHPVRLGEVPKALHVLFVGDQGPQGPRAVSAMVANRPVLVVADEGTAAWAPAAIYFAVADDRVRFDIDPRQAESHQLKISSRLMQLARRVLPAGAP